jgi:hypothetical protein
VTASATSGGRLRKTSQLRLNGVVCKLFTNPCVVPRYRSCFTSPPDMALEFSQKYRCYCNNFLDRFRRRNAHCPVRTYRIGPQSSRKRLQAHSLNKARAFAPTRLFFSLMAHPAASRSAMRGFAHENSHLFPASAFG